MPTKPKSRNRVIIKGSEIGTGIKPLRRSWLRPKQPEPEVRCADENGYPIRLRTDEEIAAVDLPPPPPPVYENPKTLRHMKNRLKALGYHIRSIDYAAGEWSIWLERGQTICFREGGEVSLPWCDRDYRLERLFNMKPA